LAILSQAAFQNSAFGQSSGLGGGGGGGGSPITSDPGISGLSVQSSELTSKADQMPRFSGFRSLDANFFLGKTDAYFPARSSAGVIQRTGTGGSTGRGSQQSSGNTRAMTTGSRATGTANMRNRNMSNMMGNMGRMGGLGGMNTNTVRSVTSLGHSFSETDTARPTEAARISRLENRINKSSKITPLAPITVELNNSTAILRGAVENEHQRKLLEQLVKLEPGISKVQNELTYPTASPVEAE